MPFQYPPVPEMNLSKWRPGIINWFQELWRQLDTTIYTFASGDTTPSVAKGNIFVTANAAPTTITNFDDATNGKQIIVIIQDSNTTIDFSGTYLIGNNGVDWDVIQGGALLGVYYNLYWRCFCAKVSLAG